MKKTQDTEPRVGEISVSMLAGVCPNGHRFCMSPRCWLQQPEKDEDEVELSEEE